MTECIDYSPHNIASLGERPPSRFVLNQINCFAGHAVDAVAGAAAHVQQAAAGGAPAPGLPRRRHRAPAHHRPSRQVAADTRPENQPTSISHCACMCVINVVESDLAVLIRCRAKPLQPAEWKQMLLGAQRLDTPLPDSLGTASTAAPQVTQPAAAQLDTVDNGGAAAVGAEGSAPRGGSWRSLGGGEPPPAAAASQHSGSAGSSVVVLDVRNGYEWDAGHFQGAARPSEASCCDRFCFPSLPTQS